MHQMIVVFSLFTIAVMAAQIVHRELLQPVTDGMDHETWEACVFPGGRRYSRSGPRGFVQLLE